MPRKKIDATDTTEKKQMCCRCSEPFDLETGFFKVNSDIYRGTNRMPICKTCLSELFNEYTVRYNSSKIAIQRICMAFDLYYSEDLFDKCNSDSNTTLGTYIRCLNMKQYSEKRKTFDTTLQEGFTFKDETKKKEKKNNNFVEEPVVDPKDTERWGGGLQYVDYSNLNRHHKFLKQANPNCDSNQEIFIDDLCYIKMQMMKAIREDRPDDYSRLSEQYRKSFEKAGLKTTRDTTETESFTVGVNIETIEKYTPVEYYKNKSLYKDHDNIGDYMERFCLRPLRNLMHGTTDRDYEFYVKDEEDVNEFTDE